MCAYTVILERALWYLGRTDESRIIVDEVNGVSVRDSNKDHPFLELDILPVRWIQEIGTILHLIYSNAIIRPFFI